MRSIAKLSVSVPEQAVPAFVAAFETACESVGFLREDEAGSRWTVEGLLRDPARRGALEAGLALASAASGIGPTTLGETWVEAEGWLARTREAFPPQPIGRRLLIRGTHDSRVGWPGRIALTIDAGLAFGSGEHETTRGCLIALETMPRPRGRVADIGAGSGVLALAAAALWRVGVLGVELDPWAARVARENARANRLHRLVRVVAGEGWRASAIRRGAPYAVVFANILARPLCAMAADAARRLAPRGRIVLSGFHPEQARLVLVAHRRSGLVLERRLDLGRWTTLVLRKR
ncbi:MAG: 50S ribosomal protein L11 methyltransferase [Acetobacteraceae bacterium]